MGGVSSWLPGRRHRGNVVRSLRVARDLRACDGAVVCKEVEAESERREQSLSRAPWSGFSPSQKVAFEFRDPVVAARPELKQLTLGSLERRGLVRGRSLFPQLIPRPP